MTIGTISFALAPKSYVTAIPMLVPYTGEFHGPVFHNMATFKRNISVKTYISGNNFKFYLK
jgi:hypothetical protein